MKENMDLKSSYKMNNNTTANSKRKSKHTVMLLAMAFSMLVANNSYGQLPTFVKTLFKAAKIEKVGAKGLEREIKKETKKEATEMFRKKEFKELESKMAERTGLRIPEKTAKINENIFNLGKKDGDLLERTSHKKSSVYMSDPKETSKALKERRQASAMKGVKQGEKEGAEKLVKKGSDAMKSLEDMPNMKKSVDDLQKKSPDYFKTDDLKVKKNGKNTEIGFEGTNSKVEVDESGVIHAKGGSTPDAPAQNEFLNHPQPNSNYEVDGINYKTNGAGQPTDVSWEGTGLKKNIPERGKTHTKTQSKVRNGNADVDSGHLVPKAEGGPNEAINQIPMNKGKQRQGSKWANFENQEREAIERAQKEGKTVNCTRHVEYHQDGTKTITASYIVEGEETVTEVFENM